MEANASGDNPTISLVGRLTDEYGFSPQTARECARYGNVLIGDDAEHLEPLPTDVDVERVPLEMIDGKVVRVQHEQRAVQFVYRQPFEQRLG